MDELEKGLALSVKGASRDEALSAFNGYMKEWGIAMPSVEPIVFDFGLDDFWRTGLVECWIANEPEAGYCGKYMFVFNGQTCPMHCHREKVETFFCVKGNVNVVYGDKTLVLRPGDSLKVETGVYHSFQGHGPALLLELSKPCVIADNYFENPAIPMGG